MIVAESVTHLEGEYLKAEVLGNVQDGGVPHLGCECDLCEKAREDLDEIRQVSSLLLEKGESDNSFRYLIDASPDIRRQVTGKFLDGAFITHAHLGHINGLLSMGIEVLDASGMPVYCTSETRDFIQKNDPYRLLIDRNNIDVNVVEDGDTVELQGGEVSVNVVDHHIVTTDTLAFTVEGEEKTLLYMSTFKKWNDSTEELVENADIAIIDGTFWSTGEIGRYEEVPHPPVKRTIEKFEDSDTEIYFTHINHTNPILREDSEERQELEDKGFDIVERGDSFEI